VAKVCEVWWDLESLCYEFIGEIVSESILKIGQFDTDIEL